MKRDTVLRSTIKYYFDNNEMKKSLISQFS